jgi:hypothetical protein
MINIWVTHNGEMIDFVLKMILIHSKSNLTLQPSHSLLDIFNLREVGIGVFPEGEVNNPSLEKYHEWSEFS